MKLFKERRSLLLNLLVVIFLFILPYYLFSGKLYLGGDDTKLFYSYPLNFLKNVNFFSWYKFSSMGINGPSQYLVSFLALWYVLSIFISNPAVLNHLAFSLPLVLGFLFFQKVVKELFSLDRKNYLEIFLGALFYVSSPILMINQMFVFLISIWLIGLIPIVTYYFLRYIRTSNFAFVFIASIWCLIFGQAIYSIPWLTGFILPVLIGLLFTAILFTKKDIIFFLKRSIVFFGYIFISQLFWLTGFISTYINLGQDSFASKFLSKGFVDTFTPTILSTATGNVMYPILNLFHRQIAFDFVWKLKEVFLDFYDKTFELNVIYIIVLAFAIFSYKKYLNETGRKIYLFLLISFVSSLYFFTVNIGPLKDLFLLFGNIPGFTMFRNFYDKFAPGYVLIYSTLISISLVMVTKKIAKSRMVILILFLLVVLINFIPVKATVDSVLWTTNSIHKEITIPNEYLKFMDYIHINISSSNNILSVPFGSSLYSIIKDENSNNAYVGVSPVKIFSGVNDISGHLSFNFTPIADIIDGLIVNRDYKKLNEIFYEHNINYVLVTKNIPKEVLNSWVFNPNMVNEQDSEFLHAITGKLVAKSAQGNYELYQGKNINSLIDSKNIYFQKISEVEYKIYLKNISKKQELSFIDSYHVGWKLFIQREPSLSFCTDPIKNLYTGSIECKAEDRLFDINDLSYPFTKSVFANTHNLKYGYANAWTIDPSYIKNNFNSSYYKVNKDGSIDVEMVLYFTPQNYFYLGILISIIVFASGILYLIFIHEKNK